MSNAWLPDHQFGVAAGLAHADELIGQISDALFTYQTQPEGIIRLQEVPDERVSRTVVSGLAPIPRRVPLLVADALSVLRNTLEHALFAEVETVQGQLDEKAARLIEVPASKTFDDFQKWAELRGRRGITSLAPGGSLTRRVQALQPFQRIQDPDNHPLAVLVAHTNHAKHRTPLITAVRLSAMYRDDQRPRSPRDLSSRPETPLQVGEVIAETPLGTQTPVSLFPSIGINRPGTDRWPILMSELDDLATWVRTQAVPRIVKGADPPTAPLPARYDIETGHDDERLALSRGSMVPAATRHQERLSAASARIDLPDLIGAVTGAPSPELLADWLASLRDDEVLERVSQLQAAYDHEVVMNNMRVLEAMRDDAIRFHTNARKGQ